jgi:hypothetical protein
VTYNRLHTIPEASRTCVTTSWERRGLRAQRIGLPWAVRRSLHRPSAWNTPALAVCKGETSLAPGLCYPEGNGTKVGVTHVKSALGSLVEKASCSTYSVTLFSRHDLPLQTLRNRIAIIMTSTNDAPELISTCSYLKKLTNPELQVLSAQTDRNCSESLRKVDGGTIRGLRPTDYNSNLPEWCDTNYENQRRIDLEKKMLARESEASAKKAVSQGASDNFEACTDIQASQAVQTTVISATK